MIMKNIFLKLMIYLGIILVVFAATYWCVTIIHWSFGIFALGLFVIGLFGCLLEK